LKDKDKYKQWSIQKTKDWKTRTNTNNDLHRKLKIERQGQIQTMISNTTGTTCGAGSACLSGALEFIPGSFRCSIFSFLCRSLFVFVLVFQSLVFCVDHCLYLSLSYTSGMRKRQGYDNNNRIPICNFYANKICLN
jgi:hypothetical protein